MANAIDENNLFEKYAIVAEQSATLDGGGHSSFSFTHGNFSCEFYATGTKIWGGNIRTIPSSSTNSTNANFVAEIVIWQWHEGKQTIVQRNLFDIEQSNYCCFDQSSIWPLNVFVRILAKKPPNALTNSSTFTPASSSSSAAGDDTFTVHIGDRQITVSAARLMAVSPVFGRMLSVDMEEKKERAVKLEGIDMEQFMEFLDAISGASLPNPKNVLDLLALSDYFMVDWLKDRCDGHLTNCVEMPLIDRFVLIERYRLGGVKNLFMRCMDLKNLGNFCFKEHNVFLCKDASKSLKIDLGRRLHALWEVAKGFK
uniref:BTB domain-containing protein n=1 Tax=Globodera rostochiensis TaxID=31243 RepID=A0A914HEG2_GLORO